MRQQTGLPSGDDVRAVFGEVLAQPDFDYVGESPLVRGVRAIFEWARDLIDRFFPTLSDTEVRVVSWILLGATVAFAIYLLVRRIREGPRPGSGVPGSLGTTSSRPRDAAEWMGWAGDAARAGRLREAATGLYQATILQLDERGALRYRDWKTPGDYALEVSEQDVRAPFHDFLTRFVEVAFGPRDPTRDDYEALSTSATKLGGSV